MNSFFVKRIRLRTTAKRWAYCGVTSLLISTASTAVLAENSNTDSALSPTSASSSVITSSVDVQTSLAPATSLTTVTASPANAVPVSIPSNDESSSTMKTTEGNNPISSSVTPPTDSVSLPVASPNQAPSVIQDFSAVGLYNHADNIVKAVILILIFASMMSWSIWLGKTMELFSRGRRMRKSLAEVADKRSLYDCGVFSVESCERMKEVAIAELSNIKGRLTHHSVEAIKERVQARFLRIEAAESRRASRGASILATTSAVAPFVGLFGTVWGIMHSFISIAQTQTTNLSVVAPGIAEALFATALGLVVAIPAVILYNITGRMITGYRIIIVDAMTHTLCLLSQDLDDLEAKQQNKTLTSVA